MKIVAGDEGNRLSAGKEGFGIAMAEVVEFGLGDDLC